MWVLGMSCPGQHLLLEAMQAKKAVRSLDATNSQLPWLQSLSRGCSHARAPWLASDARLLQLVKVLFEMMSIQPLGPCWVRLSHDFLQEVDVRAHQLLSLFMELPLFGWQLFGATGSTPCHGVKQMAAALLGLASCLRSRPSCWLYGMRVMTGGRTGTIQY